MRERGVVLRVHARLPAIRFRCVGFHPKRVRLVRLMRIAGPWLFRRWPALLILGLPLYLFTPDSVIARNPWIQTAGVLSLAGLMLYVPWSWLIHSVFGVAEGLPMRTYPALYAPEEIEPPYLLYLRNFEPERVATTETKPYTRYPMIIRVPGGESVFVEGEERMSTRVVEHPLPRLLRRVAGDRVVALSNSGDVTPVQGIRHVAVPDSEWPEAAARLIRGAACIVFAVDHETQSVAYERKVIGNAGLGLRTLILTPSKRHSYDDLDAHVICAPELTQEVEKDIEQWIRASAPEVVVSGGS